MVDCTLVFGVSGVGKTTACRDYVDRHPYTLFISASSLLKSSKGLSGEALRTATSAQIVENQAALATALAAFRSGREAQPIIVDAHGVIDNNKTLVPVPINTIKDIGPSRLILLEAPPSVVLANRKQDLRVRPERSLEAVAAEIAAERKAVEGFATALKINLAIADVGSGFKLDSLFGGRRS